jgi:hypothetical protein
MHASKSTPSAFRQDALSSLLFRKRKWATRVLSLTSINWGTISPANSVTRTVYVKNLGTTQVTLSMSGENWTPASANGPITVTWNREGTTLGANEVAIATLTLSVSSNISGITTFSVDIVIASAG